MTQTVIEDLKCEYKTAPLGISTASPRFSWKAKSAENNYRQKAYRIVIADTAENIDSSIYFYDSGMVFSEESFGVRCEDLQLKPYHNYIWRVTVLNENNKETTSECAAFSTGAFSLNDWKAKWVTARIRNYSDVEKEGIRGGYDPLGTFSPVHARAAFHTVPDKKILSAVLYSASTAGAFGNLTFNVNDVYITLNGQKIGKDIVTPGQISGRKHRAVYRAYDVTDMLKQGENVFGAVFLSLAYSAFINVEYQDGETAFIDLTADFKINGGGPYKLWDTGVEDQGGKTEEYNALKEYTGFDESGYDDSDWQSPVFTDIVASLEEQTVTTEVIYELKPISITPKGYRHYVVDFGENVNGHIRLNIKNAKAGRRISVLYGEAVYENGELSACSTTNYQRGENSPHCDSYIPKGCQTEVFEPRFANHGFRYVDIYNYNGKVETEDITALVVHSTVLNESEFYCSDEDINRLYKISKKSQQMNLASIPTDCPTRERHGWLGDAFLVCESECINFDVLTFFESWCKSIADDQEESGNVPYITPFESPTITGNVDIAWSYACIAVPLMVYKAYGDKDILLQMYPVMSKWIDFISAFCNEEGIVTGGIMWNDHTARDRMDKDWLGTLYYCACLKDFISVCSILGKNSEKYEKLFLKAQQALNIKYIKDNKFSNNYQNDLAHVISLELTDDLKEKQALELLIDSIKSENYHFTCGCLGIFQMVAALEKYGRNYIIYKLCKQDGEGTFLNWIRKYDATTSFEFLKFNEWGSRNHPFLMGSINRWFYEGLAGIKKLEPSYKVFTISPYFPQDTWLIKAKIDTNYGIISFMTEKTENKIVYEITVPCGTTAHLNLQNGKTVTFGSGSYTYSE